MILHSNILGIGKPLFILHGFLGMGDNWKTLGKKFATQGYQVHLIDQRNHGRSFHSNDFSYKFLAQDLLNYAEHNGIDNFSLLGHSMGGKTAMLFACEYPGKIDKLIIVDIAPKYYQPHHQQILNGLSALKNNSNAMQSRSAADAFIAHYISDIGIRMFLLKNLYWIEKGKLGLRVHLDALIANYDQVGKALPANKTFSGATLFLYGSKSDYIQKNDEDGIYKAFAKAQIIEIQNSGHWLHAENPNDFYREVINFL